MISFFSVLSVQILLLIFFAATPIYAADTNVATANARTLCKDFEQHLTATERQPLQIAIARQLNASQAKVLNYFKDGTWRIYYVEPNNADEGFLFYKFSPLESKFVTAWGGAAQQSERNDIESWTLKNAPGISPELAKCFSAFSIDRSM